MGMTENAGSFTGCLTHAQVLLIIRYQAVAQDKTCNLIINQPISMRFTIHEAKWIIFRNKIQRFLLKLCLLIQYD